ncbi:helix-turn-helix transcriptional regulator [Paenibacillus sp. 2RAB27]|uniref:helix-turn-helix transcriptional regulator n=1 Tax=Paenibacillus sp. 2RAB27 TaxID=3232991 RepID=UPI003F9BBC86
MGEKFDSILATARKEIGMSQEELARKANVSRETIRSIEKGTSIPNVLLALAIAAIVGLAVDKLFRNKGE